MFPDRSARGHPRSPADPAVSEQSRRYRAPVVDAAESLDLGIEHRWRVSATGRAAAAVVCLVVLVMGSLLVSNGAATSDRVWGGGMILAAPMSAWLFGWRPYVRLTPAELIIHNPLRRHTIALGAVMGADAGYSGLSLEVRGRTRPLSAWAVQKMDLSVWRGRGTRADAVAKMIVAAAYAPGLQPTTVVHHRHAR